MKIASFFLSLLSVTFVEHHYLVIIQPLSIVAFILWLNRLCVRLTL